MKRLFNKNTATASLRGKLSAFMHDTAMLPSKTHAAVLTVSLVASTNAMALGVTGFFSGWRNAATELIGLTIIAGMAIGIMAALYGIMNMIKKGMGRGDDIEWGKITWPIIGGALATILLFVLQAVVEEGGGTRGDMGRSN